MYLCTLLSFSRELLSGLVLFSGISLFSFFFFIRVVECNCDCAHHLERVLLEVISSQQVVSERFYPRLVRMFKRGRTSTMSDDAHAPTPTLHPPRSETGMSTSILMLTSTNYRLWAMRMEVSLEADVGYFRMLYYV